MAYFIRNNFTGGEVSPSISLRPDLTKYQTGMAFCENFLVRPQGGIYSRPGTNYCGQIPFASVRLIPFVFNQLQAYVLIFVNNSLYIMRDGALLTSGGSPLTVATPYSSAQIQELDYAQNADVMTLVHPSHAPRTLSRLGELTWSLSTIQFAPVTGSPVIAGASNAITSAEVTVASAGTDPDTLGEVRVTLPAWDSYSVAQKVVFGGFTGDLSPLNGREAEVIEKSSSLGGHIRVSVITTPVLLGDTDASGSVTTPSITAVGSGGGDFAKTYRYVVTAVSPDGIESVPSAAAQITTASLSVTYGVQIAWTFSGDVSYFRVYKDASGDSGVYGWIGDSENILFTDFNTAPVTSDAPPTEFATPVQPGAVTYYQQRQIFGAPEQQPQTLIASQTGRPESVRQSRPLRDDDAFSITISSPEVNRINYMVPLESLLILTEGAEWRTTEGDSEVFTPSTAGVRMTSANGCARVKPVVADDSVLYVQSQGGKLREMSYSISQDRFGGGDLTIMADHLFRRNRIKRMAYSADPDGILWCVLTDGSLVAMTYQREHEVFAWHRHDVGLPVRDCVVIPENGEDVAYFALDTGGTRLVRIRVREAGGADSGHLDQYLRYTGAPTPALSGLTHLANQEVTAVADGMEVPGLTVSSEGTLDLPFPASDIVVGLPYTCTAELLPVYGETPRGEPKSVSRIRAYVEESRGFKAGIIREDGSRSELYEAYPRDVEDSYDAPAPRTTMLELQMPNGWSPDARVLLVQDSAFMLQILAIEYSTDASR